MDGKGPPYVVDYYGTGFLVEKGGLVLTNRHVAQPWWNDATADALRQQGFQPRFVRLRAFFPGHGESLAVTAERLSEEADLALLQVDIGGRKIPVLPLEKQRARAVPGQPVVVVGYPTGLEAILAKAEIGRGAGDPGVARHRLRAGHGGPQQPRASSGPRPPRATSATSRPPTSCSTRPARRAGSGGPVFNKHGQVIAVEYAVLPKFGGHVVRRADRLRAGPAARAAASRGRLTGVRLPEPGPARDRAIALLFAAASAAFRLPRLGFPETEIFDEVYHAKTALQYLQGESPTEWVHPPTAKLLIAIGVWVFGYESWAWRLLPAAAGIALAPVFYYLARAVLATERAAVLATALLLADGVYLVQSRTAMTNIFAVLFQVAAALFVVRAVLPAALSARAMAWAGLFLGLALSTRWTSLWAWGFLGLVMLVVRGRRLFTLRELALAVTTFALIPLVALRPQLRAVDGAGPPRHRAVGAHAGGLGLPREPARRAPVLQLLVHVAVAVPAHLVLLHPGGPDRRAGSWPSATRSCGGSRCRCRRGRSSPASAPATPAWSSPASASPASTCRGGSRRARSTTATTSSRPSPTPA